MTNQQKEIIRRIKEVDKLIEEHILIHHSGQNAGVLKLQKCEQYQLLQLEKVSLQYNYSILKRREEEK